MYLISVYIGCVLGLIIGLIINVVKEKREKKKFEIAEHVHITISKENEEKISHRNHYSNDFYKKGGKE